jgi:hypothetical protein
MNQISRRTCAALPFFIAFATFPGRSVTADIPLPATPNSTNQFERMRQGKVAPDKEQIETLAKWLTHRLVHPPYNGLELNSKTSGQADLQSLLTEVERWCRWPNPGQAPNDLQLQYAKEFGKAMEYELLYIMAEASSRLDKVNAARMLAVVGKLPYEALADTYLKIIREEKYPPQIKLYAFEGLRNLLAVPSNGDFNDPSRQFLERSPKLPEIALELDKYITQPLPANLNSEEIRVIQFVRREAVRALAQVKPCVIRKQQDTLAKPIWTLLRVATNDSIITGAAPKSVDDTLPGYPYHILERIEALIGICSMNPDRALNAELVAYLIADTLLDVTAFHDAERARFLKDTRNKALVPWQIMGSKLSEAMNLWKERTALNKYKLAGAPVAANLVDLAIQKCLSKLEKEGVSAVPDNRWLKTWKDEHKPKSAQVLAEDESTTVKIK